MVSFLTYLGATEIEQVHLLNETDHEQLQAELCGAEALLEMAKGEAAKAFEEGYSACIQKFAEPGVDISGRSVADCFAALEEEFCKEPNPSDPATPA